MKRLPIPPKSLAAFRPPRELLARLVLPLLAALPACAQQPVSGEADRGGAAAATTAVAATPAAAPVPDSAAAAAAAAAQAPVEAQASSDSAEQSAAPESAATAEQKTPYAFACVPYDDRPKPRRRIVRKEAQQTAPAEPPPAVEPPAEQKPENSAVISILGKKVFDRGGEDVGRVVDVLADSGGRARAAVIDFGGFLGVGNRRVAVDWRALQIDPANPDKPVVLELSREQVAAAPEFKESDHPEKVIVTKEHPANAAAAPAHPP